MQKDYSALKLSTPGVLPKPEEELRRAFLDQLEAVPGGERIKACIQCGTCTGSCPVSYLMDIPPREVMALFRAGDVETILRSRTIWVCASCYACTTRCPAGIKVTDILYALKRTAMSKGIFPQRFPIYAVSENFVRMVNRYGRNYEVGLMALFALRSSPRKLFTLLPLAWRLARRGRVAFLPRRIKGREQIKRIMAKARSLPMPVEGEQAEFTSTVGYGASTEAIKEGGTAAR